CHQPDLPPVVQGAELPAQLLDAGAGPRPAVRAPRHIRGPLAVLPRRKAEQAAARARRDERHGRELRGGVDAGLVAARAEAGPGRDQDLRRPATRPLRPGPHVQPARRPGNAGTYGHAGTTRLLEPRVDLLRGAPPAVRGPVGRLSRVRARSADALLAVLIAATTACEAGTGTGGA